MGLPRGSDLTELLKLRILGFIERAMNQYLEKMPGKAGPKKSTSIDCPLFN